MTNTGRPNWDEWGVGLAVAVAARADCTRRKVGAVLMRPDHSIVSTGYNGAPPGGPSCLKGQCPRGLQPRDEVPEFSSYDTGPGSCIALHAEQNALLRATWDEMAGSTLYVTCAMCDGCRRMVAGTPIVRVVWPHAENGSVLEWRVHGGSLLGKVGRTDRVPSPG